MQSYRHLIVAATLVAAWGCGASNQGTGGSGGAGGPTVFMGYHASTLNLGATDNSEIIKVQPGTNTAFLVGSKTRKISRLTITGDTVAETTSAVLFANDATESELTHLALGPDALWAVVTRTLIQRDGAGAAIGCAGEAVFVDLAAATFGTVLAQVAVGPMPDAVALTPDAAYAVVANERDVVWGKCEGVVGLDPASVSIISLAGGPAAAVEARRIIMSDAAHGEREPESVAIAADGDVVAVTLQDSHELALFRLSDILNIVDPTAADTAILLLPANSTGAMPWPDGVAAVQDGAGASLFVIAGEAADTVIVVDGSDATAPTLVGQRELTPSDVPAAFPRDGSWGPLFQPDSVTSFSYQGARFVAVTLKAAGAVSVLRVDDGGGLVASAIIKVGNTNELDSGTASVVAPEGVAARDGGLVGDEAFLVTANEGESSVSLIRPERPIH